MKGWLIFFLVLFISLAILFSMLVAQSKTYLRIYSTSLSEDVSSKIELIKKTIEASAHIATIISLNNSQIIYCYDSIKDFEENLKDNINKNFNFFYSEIRKKYQEYSIDPKVLLLDLRIFDGAKIVFNETPINISTSYKVSNSNFLISKIFKLNESIIDHINEIDISQKLSYREEDILRNIVNDLNSCYSEQVSTNQDCDYPDFVDCNSGRYEINNLRSVFREKINRANHNLARENSNEDFLIRYEEKDSNIEIDFQIVREKESSNSESICKVFVRDSKIAVNKIFNIETRGSPIKIGKTYNLILSYPKDYKPFLC